MPKVTTPLLVEDFYKTTLTADVNASWDIELEVTTPPLNKKGFIIVNPESNSERERMYYHDVIGNIIYVKWVNRIDPKEHFALDKVQINDTSLIFNYLSKALSTTFFVEQLTSLWVKIFWWPILKWITTVSVSDTSLTMVDWATNYIYYKASTNEIKTAISEVTVWTDKWIIVADVVTASGIITSISYRHHKLFIGRDIESVTKTNTVWLVDTYTILYSDQTTSTFNITNGSSIANITYTSTLWLVDTYTVTLTNWWTTTFEVTNWNWIEDISYTSSAWSVDTYTITFQDWTTSTFDVTNGRWITNIEKTSTLWMVDTYTITYNDDTTSTFNITNWSVTPEQVQKQSHIYNIATWTANNYLLTITWIASYVAWLKVAFKANFTNTWSATLNINSIWAITLKKLWWTTNLEPWDTQNGQIIEVTYDWTNFQIDTPVWQNLNALKTDIKFWWNWSDWALNITTWTTTLTLVNNYIEKNYSSINISWTALLDIAWVTASWWGIAYIRCKWDFTMSAWTIQMNWQGWAWANGAYRVDSVTGSNWEWFLFYYPNTNWWGWAIYQRTVNFAWVWRGANILLMKNNKDRLYWGWWGGGWTWFDATWWTWWRWGWILIIEVWWNINFSWWTIQSNWNAWANFNWWDSWAGWGWGGWCIWLYYNWTLISNTWTKACNWWNWWNWTWSYASWSWWGGYSNWWVWKTWLWSAWANWVSNAYWTWWTVWTWNSGWWGWWAWYYEVIKNIYTT